MLSARPYFQPHAARETPWVWDPYLRRVCLILSAAKSVGNFKLKSCPMNVDKIDTCSQFHQYFTSSFCANFFHQKFTNTNCKHKKGSKTLWNKNSASKMLVKLTPEHNWIVFLLHLHSCWYLKEVRQKLSKSSMASELVLKMFLNFLPFFTDIFFICAHLQ